jgi:ring-1,2-phenylacetyl-CoA epoxidase subunit PaaC
LNKDATINYSLYLADNSLILSQRNAEWCGHGPVLEQDIAITNISLDLLGQARNFYQYAALLLGKGATEDSLACIRTEREFKNCLLAEQPIGDWAYTILRQYLFSEYLQLLYVRLLQLSDTQLSAIAEKALKEVSYHTRWSSEWVIRLADGTDESRNRITTALNDMWKYTGEFFISADYEKEMDMDLSNQQNEWLNRVKKIFGEANLLVPENVFMQTGGKQGKHTEHLGFILTDLQYMQRAYPNCEW